jgi:hypothetical protein
VASFQVLYPAYVEIPWETVSMLSMFGNEIENGSFQIRSRNASIVWTQECFRKELVDIFCSVSRGH